MQVKFEYSKSEKHYMFALTRKDLSDLKVLQQWNMAIYYEANSLLSDVIKVKATRAVPDEPVLKVEDK